VVGRGQPERNRLGVNAGLEACVMTQRNLHTEADHSATAQVQVYGTASIIRE